MTNSLRLVRLRQLVEKTGLGRSTIYAEIAKGNFPKQHSLFEGGRSVAWLESDVDEWIRHRVSITTTSNQGGVNV